MGCSGAPNSYAYLHPFCATRVCVQAILNGAWYALRIRMSQVIHFVIFYVNHRHTYQFYNFFCIPIKGWTEFENKDYL